MSSIVHRPTAATTVLSLLVALFVSTVGAQAPSTPLGRHYTLLSAGGRRIIGSTVVNGQDMVRLAELAEIFQFTLREDTLAGGLTVTSRGTIIVLTTSQGLASVGGRLVSLSAPPVRDGEGWLVPVDFVSRALSLASDTRIDLRRGSRLIVIGELRVPRVVVEQDVSGNRAELTFEILPPTPHAVVDEPPRLLVTFEADAIDATLPNVTAPDFIEGIRVADGAASIVIAKGRHFGTYRAVDQPGGAASRLILEISSPAATTEPEAPGPAPAPPDPVPPPDRGPQVRTIVIDPGHGGEESGARGPSGVQEKDVTLGVARRLRSAIEARLGLRVLLTRDGDQTVGLDERAALANNNKAHLFISLHANASVRPGLSGAEVYSLSAEAYGEGVTRAIRQAEALPVFGGGTREIEVIPWEMAQLRYVDQSARFAAIVAEALQGEPGTLSSPTQQAPLRVLVGANMPAVLVEMGFLSNPSQERQLASDGYQNAIVRALLEGVMRFRDELERARPANAVAPGEAPAVSSGVPAALKPGTW